VSFRSLLVGYSLLVEMLELVMLAVVTLFILIRAVSL